MDIIPLMSYVSHIIPAMSYGRSNMYHIYYSRDIIPQMSYMCDTYMYHTGISYNVSYILYQDTITRGYMYYKLYHNL